ncbi:MAG: ABC transporter substrate-binding protein [Thermomicrobiales bacterium]
MQRMVRRMTQGVLVVLLLAILGQAAGAGAQDDVTTLTFWGDWSGEGETQIQAMVDAFNAAHPNIQVEYVVQEDMITKFLTAATAGQTPDVMLWDRWRTALYAPKGVLAPIDEYLERDGIAREDFYGEALRELTWDDQLYGLPLTVDARALFYNEQLLAEAGVEPPTTWAELEAAAVALTKRDGDTLTTAGFALNDVGLFSMYLQQAGGQMVADDCSETTFNSPEGLAVLDLWQRMMDQGVYELGFEEGLGEGQDAFVTGRVAMLYTGPWMITTYQKYGADLDFGVVSPPSGPDGDQSSVMGGFGLTIPAASEKQDAAWEFVKWWLAEPANAVTWGQTSSNFPGNTVAIQDRAFSEDPLRQPFLETFDFARVRPPCAGYSPMEIDGLIPNLQLFMEGKQSAQETLDRAQEEGDRLLAENNVS